MTEEQLILLIIVVTVVLSVFVITWSPNRKIKKSNDCYCGCHDTNYSDQCMCGQCYRTNCAKSKSQSFTKGITE